jgi:antitoxin YefM
MAITYSELRQHLKEKIDLVIDTHEPLLITSRKAKKAVLMSYDDYESLIETVHLLKNPAMARRLFKAMDDVKAGKLVERKLMDDET